MANITIKLENGQYNFYQDDTLVKSNLSVRTVKKDDNGNMTVGDIVLPENPTGKKTLSTTRFKDGITEFDITNLTPKMSGKNTTKSTKIDLSEYYTDEEKSQIEKLQAKIDKINENVMARAQKDLKMKELKETLKSLDPETLKALMATIEVKA